MKLRLLLFSLLTIAQAGIMSAQVRELTEDDWYDLDIVRPIIIDVYAPWCGPCKYYSPTFSRVASEFSDKADFYRINGDRYEDFSADFGIGAYPSTLIMSEYYSDGFWIEVGLMSYEELKYNVIRAIERFEHIQSLPAEVLMEMSDDYYLGQNGKEKNILLAEEYMHRAACRDCVEAQYLMARIYEDIRARDPERAAYWYEQAALQGHDEAQNYLAYLIYYGYYGLEQSFSQAVYWWLKSAEQGNASAQYNLGTCYFDGEGVEKDVDKASYWLHLSAEQGFDDAIEFLETHKFD